MEQTERRTEVLREWRREPQRRMVDVLEARVRAAQEGAPKLNFTGHAAVFEQRTYIGPPPWGFFEEIARGAFANAIARPDDVRMLVNHDPNLLLARTASGTLRLAEDKVGLLTTADMADTSYGRDASVVIDRGDMTQMSFAFLPEPGGEEWSKITITDEETGTELEADLVTVKSVELFDVSPVTYPAYTGTDGAVRMRSHRDEARIVRATLVERGAFDPATELEMWERLLPRA